MLAQGGAIFGTGLFCQGSYPGWMYVLLGFAKLLAISISVCAGMLSPYLTSCLKSNKNKSSTVAAAKSLSANDAMCPLCYALKPKA